MYHLPVFPHLHLKIQARLCTIRAVSRTVFNVESLYRTVSTHFEPLYTSMYHIGLSDGAVSHYTLKFEIYGATLYRNIFLVTWLGVYYSTLPVLIQQKLVRSLKKKSWEYSREILKVFFKIGDYF